MIVAGAGGHAKEIAGIFNDLNQIERVFFFDDKTLNGDEFIFNRFEIIKTDERVKAEFQNDARFVLGVGNPNVRRALAEKLSALGGILTSVISPFSRIGSFSVTLGEGLNIMTGAVITQQVIIGKGCLINCNAIIHHDCRIGDFCELSPGCILLGKVTVGDFSIIGAGAVVLPGVKIGNNAIIGAGAVVTKNVEENATVVGVPAR